MFRRRLKRSKTLEQAKAEAAAVSARALLSDPNARKISHSHQQSRNGPITTSMILLREENEELSSRCAIRDHKINLLSKEVELLRTAISVMTEDLSVKEDQFVYLFASLRDSGVFVQQDNSQAEDEFDRRLHRLEQMENSVLSHSLMEPPQCSSTFVSLESTSESSSSSLPFLLSKLPFECREMIASQLQFVEYGRCCCVNKEWNNSHTESEVWFREYHRHWDPESRTESVARSLRAAPAHRSGPKHTWKTRCERRARVEAQWMNGRPLITTLVGGHQGTVTCLGVDSSGSRMVSGSDDGSLWLWREKEKEKEEGAGEEGREEEREEEKEGIEATEKKYSAVAPLCQQHHRQTHPSRRIRAFQGHGGPVWCLHVAGDVLYSGSYDKTIKMWNINTGKCQQTLRGHTGWVSCMDMISSSSGSTPPSMLISGGWDATVKLWNCSDGRLLRTIPKENNSDAVYCLKCDRDGMVAVGGRCPDVCLLDVSSSSFSSSSSRFGSLRMFKGHCMGVNAVHVDRASEYGRLVTASSDTTVKVWDDRAVMCVGTLKHGGAVMCVAQDQYKVVSGCYDKTIRIFDLRRMSATSTPCCVRSLEAHSGAIFSLMVDYANNQITSGSADHTIKTFQFNN